MHRITDNIAENEELTGGCQVVLQHSPVGESAANGMIDDTIQRVQGQVRAIRLDWEAAAGSRIDASFPIWSCLIEFVAQTLLMWRISGDDGLTAQRTRGRSRTTPKSRFGEKVLYEVPRTIRVGKAEARWNGIWLGRIEYSDEHLVGTEDGVKSCRSTAGVSHNFGAKAIEEMHGTLDSPPPYTVEL